MVNDKAVNILVGAAVNSTDEDWLNELAGYKRQIEASEPATSYIPSEPKWEGERLELLKMALELEEKARAALRRAESLIEAQKGRLKTLENLIGALKSRDRERACYIFKKYFKLGGSQPVSR